MGDFSASTAIGAGFRLIGRAPLAFLAWALTYLVLGIAPQIGYFAAVLPEWSRITQEIAANAGSHLPMNSADMFRAQMGMMQLQPLVWISSLVSHTLVLGAIYRAVLQPQDSKFFYLRLSARELWLGLTMLVLVVVGFLLMIVALVPNLILVGFVSALAREAPGVQLMIPAALFLAFAVVVWVLLRLSMATPMSFDQSRFRLYESWDLTRGQAGGLFLVALVLAVIIWVVEMVVAGVAFAALGGFANLERLTGWVTHPSFDVARLMPWIVVGGIVLSIVSTAFYVLFAAGWAEIYRELSDAPEPVGGF